MTEPDSQADDETTVLERIKAVSPSRLGVGRSGTRPPTASVLSFRADHARARDAVLTRVSAETIENNDLLKITSRVSDQDEYLARPDFGREIGKETAAQIRETCVHAPDVQIIVCDGLSSTAVEANVGDLLPMLIDGVKDRGLTLGTPLFVEFGRVDVMDAVGEELDAEIVVNLIGERPGLNTAKSLSAYLVYGPERSKPTAKKSVISNIHPEGLPPIEAGARIVELISTMHEQQQSGLDLQ